MTDHNGQPNTVTTVSTKEILKALHRLEYYITTFSRTPPRRVAAIAHKVSRETKD